MIKLTRIPTQTQAISRPSRIFHFLPSHLLPLQKTELNSLRFSSFPIPVPQTNFELSLRQLPGQGIHNNELRNTIRKFHSEVYKPYDLYSLITTGQSTELKGVQASFVPAPRDRPRPREVNLLTRSQLAYILEAMANAVEYQGIHSPFKYEIVEHTEAGDEFMGSGDVKRLSKQGIST